MLEFKSKVLTIIVNILLGVWQITQWFTAIIGLIIFHNYEWYKNEEAGIKVLKVNKGNFVGGACFSSGPVIFVTPNCDNNTIRHETGHSVQSLMFGPFFHILVSLPSIVLFWTRRFCNKSQDWYLSHWPENSAEKLGHTHRGKK